MSACFGCIGGNCVVVLRSIFALALAHERLMMQTTMEEGYLN